MEHGSSMTFTLSPLFPLLIRAGRIIKDTCSAWLVLCVCSQGAGSFMLAPAFCRVLDSGFACLSGRKGEVPTCSWPCDLSVG